MMYEKGNSAINAQYHILCQKRTWKKELRFFYTFPDPWSLIDTASVHRAAQFKSITNYFTLSERT